MNLILTYGVLFYLWAYNVVTISSADYLHFNKSLINITKVQKCAYHQAVFNDFMCVVVNNF